MDAFLEENYKFNGSDSWIHCLMFDFKESKKIRYHYHEYIEILFFLEGEGNVLVNERKNKYSKDSLIIINSQRAHAIDIAKPSTYICIKVMPDILYTNEYLGDEFKYVLPFTSEIRNEYCFAQSETHKMEIYDILSSIMKEWNAMNYGFELIIKSKLLTFFANVLRHLHNHKSINESDNIRPEIKAAIMYVATNYATVSEKDIAQICHFSYNYFSYLFRKAIGKNFKDYLVDIKILQAKKLLLSTKKSITEIAQETGFSTSSHFITHFKKRNGITPLKLRKIALTSD